MAKYPDVTAGQVEAAINRMEGYENFVRFIGGQGNLVFEETGSNLKLLGVVELSSTERFIIGERFIRDVSHGSRVSVNYKGKNFIKWFGDKREGSIGQRTIRYSQLDNRPLDDVSIIYSLGGVAKAETRLSDLYGFIDANAELLKTTSAVVSYVRDKDGILRNVRTSWRDDGFDVGAYDISDPRPWDKGVWVLALEDKAQNM